MVSLLRIESEFTEFVRIEVDGSEILMDVQLFIGSFALPFLT